MAKQVLLGDEAVAQAAIDAGVSAAYGYPGTPSTEILEYLIEKSESGGFKAAWCANEKTALESALGVSFIGQRSLVTMKHVGLNVAADPFLNAAVLKLGGGLVIAVADDPGMHSSQDEQDSRFYADFAMVPCFEPASQQEAYDMVREAFDVSERFHAPALLRLVTRLSHSRATVETGAARGRNGISKSPDKGDWMLLPAFARRNYDRLCSIQKDIEAWSDGHALNRLTLNEGFAEYGVITTGLGKNYYEENLADLGVEPPRLHIGCYPPPFAKIRALARSVKRIVVIEEGQPVVERILRGIYRDGAGIGLAGQGAKIQGKLDGTLPRSGELTPEIVRSALGLTPRAGIHAELPRLPNRPPQLCKGCPHGDSYAALNEALAGLESVSVTSDIGCYALGALPPYQAIESIVCMGASIGMARGASDCGIEHAVAVIGDSTFFHSGLTPLTDAVSVKAPITVLILDNSIVAMTGCQETILPAGSLEAVVAGLGVEREHIRVIDASPSKKAENAAIMRQEILYRGPSVVIARRICLEAFRKRPKGAAAKGAAE
jgi:indolepyruvate ferredoxin oxidoreductase, alpha subunit